MKRYPYFKTLFKYLILIVGLVIFAGPLLWLILTMLKTRGQTLAYPPEWFPSPITFDGFVRLFENLPLFGRWIFNSFVVSTTFAVGTVLSSSIVAFGFARTKARYKFVFFSIVLATLMVPEQITLIPLFIIFKQIGWYDTWLPLIVPAFFGNAYFIFLFRQFFLSIPFSLDEATYMDGGNLWTVYRKVVMPLSLPALMTGFIFSFVESWTDFFTPFLFLQSETKYTISVGLQLLIGIQSQDVPALAAGAFISLLPIAVIYFFAQRYFVEGIVLSGTKG
ncbi:carbohydrate ABC transporter permease [Oceanobacillus neutriphilus]|uniref:Sugar ABC transporter permease n=1 Tax=Oceanobacillus neutriphilus TaxID=531815 RepID=A0ABQ2NXT9_9BACI|nr:carbohydrate ABC transporter permease [Oceanobacillus neutriphilus]GGP13257.1 sugar ABC transporter permease [Oceanobacillus neutriphilus]